MAATTDIPQVIIN